MLKYMFNLNFIHLCYIDGMFQSKFPFKDNNLLFWVKIGNGVSHFNI